MFVVIIQAEKCIIPHEILHPYHSKGWVEMGIREYISDDATRMRSNSINYISRMNLCNTTALIKAVRLKLIK